MFYFLSSPWLCWMCDVVTPCYALFCFSQWSFYVQLTVLKISFLPWYFYCEWILCCTVKMTFTVTEIFTVNHQKNQTPAERNWIKLKCYEWKWMNSNWSMRRLTFYGLDILQFVAVLGRWYLTLAAPHSTLDLCWASFNTWRWLHLIKYLTLAAPHSTLDVACISFNFWCFRLATSATLRLLTSPADPVLRHELNDLPLVLNCIHANSYTFQMIQENTDVHWHFQRYGLIQEYYERPWLPPPFTLFMHIYLTFKWCMTRNEDRPSSSDFSEYGASSI